MLSAGKPLLSMQWHPDSPYSYDDNPCDSAVAAASAEQRGRRLAALLLQNAIMCAKGRRRERLERELAELQQLIAATDFEIDAAVVFTGGELD